MSSRILTIVVVAGVIATAQADTIHVDDDACPGPGDGSQLNPYCSIQTAIDNAAMEGDEIIVAPGTYFETIDFLGKAITLRSSDGPEVTIIDAQQMGTVVTCDYGGVDCALDGFTITGGRSGVGGGMAISGAPKFGGSATVNNCRFSGNSADSSGGGMYILTGSPTVINCIFSDNTALTGGAIFNSQSSPTVINCTFSDNTATDGAGGAMRSIQLSNPTVTNCILWGDSPDEFCCAPDPTVNYCNIQGGLAGVGNIDADPLFVDPGNGDFRLQAGSPCIDAGDNAAVPEGVLRDLDGNPRFIADACAGAPWAIVDIGAYEFQGTSCDLGNVMQVLAAWGYCEDCRRCRYDFDGDCTVGVLDLLVLLGNWQ